MTSPTPGPAGRSSIAQERLMPATPEVVFGAWSDAEAMAAARMQSIFLGQRNDWILEGNHEVRERWHNLKYYTWVEQQGKTVEELDAQRDPGWWVEHQEMVPEIDERMLEAR